VLATFDLDSERVTINLRGGDDITCVFNNVFTGPTVTTTDNTPPTVVVVPTATPTPINQVGGIQATPTPSPTRVNEIGGVRATPTRVNEVESVRGLPQTGTGGPMADATHGGSSFPWPLVVVASVLGAFGLVIGIGRRRRGDAS
jgi:hypothetical protein